MAFPNNTVAGLIASLVVGAAAGVAVSTYWLPVCYGAKVVCLIVGVASTYLVSIIINLLSERATTTTSDITNEIVDANTELTEDMTDYWLEITGV